MTALSCLSVAAGQAISADFYIAPAEDPMTGQPTKRPDGIPISFQEALDVAALGDSIILGAGASYQGQFVLRAKTGTPGWITIESEKVDRNIAPGQRVDPRVHRRYLAKLLPKTGSTNKRDSIIVAQHTPGVPNSAPSHYRFLGIEFATPRFLDHLVRLGSDVADTDCPAGTVCETERSISDLPHHFVFERCYFHGDPANGARRGIAMNAGDGMVVRTGTGAWPEAIDWANSQGGVQVLDSYFADFKHPDWDTQALASWAGAGPFRIENNYLEAAGENVIFGGWDPTITDLVPSDIEIRRNYLFKPLGWNKWDSSVYLGKDWSVKNIFELKNARRVLIYGNVMENNWVDDQNGFAILFTPRNQNGTAPWSVIEDVRFVGNILSHTSGGVNMLGSDDIYNSQQMKRVEIVNNLFEDVDRTKWGGDAPPANGGLLFQLLNGVDQLTITGNTGLQSRGVIMAVGNAAHRSVVFANNITRHNYCVTDNNCGITGEGTPPGTPSIATYMPDAVIQGNVLFRGNETGDWTYPAGNFFPEALEFMDEQRGDYRQDSYPWAGVKWTELCQATAGIVPPATTLAAKAGRWAAVLSGSFFANCKDTIAWFEWGTSPNLSLFNSTPRQSIGAGATSRKASARLTLLTPRETYYPRTYYYRAVAQTGSTVSRGGILSFTVGR